MFIAKPNGSVKPGSFPVISWLSRQAVSAIGDAK